MPDSPITKRETIAGGVIAALVTAAVPLLQVWAEGQRQKAGEKASTVEIEYFAPIIRQQLKYAERLERQIDALEKKCP